MRLFDGQWVAVTGAAGGLGGAVARLLRRRGARTICIDRIETDRCDHSIIADFSNQAALRKLCEDLAADPPDILVNIPGGGRFRLGESRPLDALDLCYRLHLAVPAVLARTVAGPMRARGSGHIVNVGSLLDAIPCPWFAAYSSSKAGLAALSQAMRRELADSGVAVTHVNPRLARTAFSTDDASRSLEIPDVNADDSDRLAERIVDAIAARRPCLNIGAMARLHAALNAFAPMFIDNGSDSLPRRARASSPRFPEETFAPAKTG
jgi:short-subunit dehydrogenase